MRIEIVSPWQFAAFLAGLILLAVGGVWGLVHVSAAAGQARGMQSLF